MTRWRQTWYALIMVLANENATSAHGASLRSGVVLLHGFLGGGSDWDDVQPTLGGRPIWAPDLPGHGPTPVTAAPLSLDGWADLVAEGIRSRFDVPPALVGYSLGGRVALRVAERHPGAFSRLVLVSTNPGIEDAEGRRARAGLDDRRAEELVADTEGFLRRWYAARPFGLRGAVLDRMVARRMQNDPTALARVVASLSPGRQPASWHVFDGTRADVIVGAEDTRYHAIANQIMVRQGGGTYWVVAEAGHGLPAEAGRSLGLVLRRVLRAGDGAAA